MMPLEDEEVKSEPEETIAEKVKLFPGRRKNEGTELKILTPNKLLTRLAITLFQINAANNSYKLKNEVKKMLYLLYKIIEKVYSSSIKS